jgi:hypothetical protein
MSDFYSAANAATNGREVFRSQQAAGEVRASAVKHIAPIGERRVWGGLLESDERGCGRGGGEEG